MLFKVSLGNNFKFITVMQKNRSFILNVEMNCLIKKRPYKTDKSHVLSGNIC